MVSYRHKKTFRDSSKKYQNIAEKIRGFIIRNSKNGYFTKVETLAYKFEIPYSKAWQITGDLLADGIIEAYHDDRGEMKVCEYGKTFQILQKTKKSRPKSNIKHKAKKSFG